ncbi:hypothetical protein F0562_017000 [Nyssa sinensis]|uniref:Nuclear factor related to kappa-B-binding protein second winged helix domain-containing protein n=1 Tax=Nyssa sinensis TaxID=561372 RepID=A0A5J4ZF80_9ASTE|nr:hypothetical protein F0562_017000 [Nyssa sinensis]
MMGHDHCDGYTLDPRLDVSSQCSEVEKHAKQNPKVKLKFVRSMKDLDGQAAQISGKDHAEKPAYEMADQRDLDAACVLVNLAKDFSCLPKNDIASSRRNIGVFQMMDSELLTTELVDDSTQHASKYGGNDKMKGISEKLKFSLSKAHCPERKQKKRKVENEFPLPQSKKYRNYYISEEEKNDSHEVHELEYGHGLTSKLGKKGRQNLEACASDDGLDMEYLERKTVTKKRSEKAEIFLDGSDEYHNLRSRSKKLIDESEPISFKKKLGSQKEDAETVSLDSGAMYDTILSEKAAVDDMVPVINPAEKQQFSLITPNLYTRFSFSIIHLLSAVRMALITPHAEDYAVAIGKSVVEDNRRQRQFKDTQNGNSQEVDGFHSCENRGVINSEQMAQKILPSLTIHEIVQRVRSNPRDPCILETLEPLVDLVRGVLKIFSSRTAPLGAKGWKALTVYENSSKSWSWIGPVSINLSDDDYIEEGISPEAWGLPRRILVKLVDCFANWLKNGQETLQQIGSLPAPPMILMQPTNAKERFKDMRAQRSLSTISPSSDEVRAYFHREETLRYLIPDRAFSYTALDGRKSTVAPLRRCSGKPSAKARDHFMLKHNRPPHVTLLCLVRDAAARLPGSIGTRADVCTLIRDSQFIVEDISDSQVNQVVSGALDRLHYELDPCVQFDKDRHLWVYLHGEREEEEFENDGTSSRKNWKRQGEMLERNLA